jgi:hypothetical protein
MRFMYEVWHADKFLPRTCASQWADTMREARSLQSRLLREGIQANIVRYCAKTKRPVKYWHGKEPAA